jgi:hypothetical protein
MDGGLAILFLIIITFAYWLTPIILIIKGLSTLKSNPEKAKMLLIIAATMLVIGIGFCGLMM